ncbi:MAG TPA: xanthine dehydrogenase family protein molybdopterin-binding subunit [Lacunisphaera sp.]|jgi:xanthine dehydrogenase YagR molybdenum-binding subunit
MTSIDTAAPVSPVGQPRDRVDGRAKVMGRATYAADAPVRNAVHAVIVQSTISRGRIESMDASAVEKSPGVIAVLTPNNMPKLEKASPDAQAETRTPLSDLEVLYAGQHIAVVVADTLEHAQHAATFLKVDYAAKPPVLDLNDPAAKIERPAKDPLGQKLQLEKGDVAAALAGAGVIVVKETYSTPVETHNPMEMSATVAYWEGKKLTVWDATQAVVSRRKSLASLFGLKPEDVRVLCPFVGGAFGCKGDQWPHTVLAAAAAQVVGRPVKLMLTRPEMFTSCGHRPVTEQTLTLGATKDGRLVAIKHETKIEDSDVGKHIEPCGVGSSAVMYATPNLALTHQLSRVNIASTTFMRAPGENPGTFALESAMDELAIALKIDPVQLRLVNYTDKAPHNDLPFSTSNVKECYRLGAEKFGWHLRNPEPRSMTGPRGERVGWGMATATYPGHRFPNQARIRVFVDRDGGLSAIGASATQDLGTGAYTVCTQMTAMLVGLPFERVKFELGDTNLPPGGVSGGSATTAGVGQALSEAAGKLREAALEIAQGKIDSPLAGLKPTEVVLRDAHLASIENPAQAVALTELMTVGEKYLEGMNEANPASADNFPAKRKAHTFQSFGAHFVEVYVDPDLPIVRVNRVVSVMDVGRVVNPKTAGSQVQGGVIMGIGQALFEETHYDRNTGRVVNDNLADYVVCVNPDVHSIETHFVGEPDLLFNAIGCRGVGEIGITGINAAIANAVHHATGVRVRDLPITAAKLLRQV